MIKLSLAAAHNPLGHPPPELTQQPGPLWQLRFNAMASPCEVLLDAPDLNQAQLTALCEQLVCETWRIEHKYSRYQTGNIIHTLNQAQGQKVLVDAETQQLLAFADTCFQLSGGLFDITSGILRRLWRFKGDQPVPTPEQIQALLPLIGWQKCLWDGHYLQIPAGAEIDLGGIGKEYAADKALQLLVQATQGQPAAFLVNFGGDIAASGPRTCAAPWQVGLKRGEQVVHIPLVKGGIATSGDSHRFIWHQGVKLSHILNPHTGWPVTGGPSTVTVFAHNCTQAGMLATFALLHGSGAEEFLSQQNCTYILG
ncbi:MAG: FAD:protein FMN transferase [Marinagarivorans sp.]